MEWKYSAMGVRSLAFGVASLPYADQAMAVMKPETVAAFKHPATTAWHDGSIVIDSSEAVRRFGGTGGVEAMHFAAVKKSLGPVMAPFLKVSLALFGTSPETLFKRINDSLGTVMRGVRTEWTSSNATSGQLVITHPDDVLEVSWPCWRGSLQFTYDLCNAKGHIVPRPELASPRTLVFDLSWA